MTTEQQLLDIFKQDAEVFAVAPRRRLPEGEEIAVARTCHVRAGQSDREVEAAKASTTRQMICTGRPPWTAVALRISYGSQKRRPR